MNKFNEIKNRPLYHYQIQEMVNDLPFWSKARMDKHSNYQSIMSDLLDPLFDLKNYTEILSLQQYPIFYSHDESEKVYQYSINSPEFYSGESDQTTYKIPVEVTGVYDGQNYILTNVQAENFADLNNRIMLTIDSISSKPYTLKVLANNLEASFNKEITFYVNDLSYIGFSMTPKESFPVDAVPFLPTDFYLKESVGNRDLYLFSSMTLSRYGGTDLERINIVPETLLTFTYPLTQGLYKIKLHLLDENQLQNYDLNLIHNRSFDLDVAIQGNSIYSEKNGNRFLSFFKVQDSYFINYFSNFLTNSETILESYLLLDKNPDDQSEEDPLGFLTPDSWIVKEKVLYAKKQNKLYLYSAMPHGSDYVYENNAQYAFDIVCDDIDYRTGDTILLELRKKIVSRDIIALRMKVQNAENDESFYIDKAGNIVDEHTAWRDYNANKVKDNGLEVIAWNFNIDNIGSYKFVLESPDPTNNIVTLGAKIILVDYKYPFKILELDQDYTGWNLSVDPNTRIVLTNHSLEEEKVISFIKDGYFFDKENAKLWTNSFFSSITLTYE
jgi:hypothetical protein